jgi:hypothetical protein
MIILSVTEAEDVVIEKIMEVIKPSNIVEVESVKQDKSIRIFFGFYMTEADPWYTGNFDKTHDDIVEGCEAFINK